MITVQRMLPANIWTEVYTTEVLTAEAMQVDVYLSNQSQAHWMDVDVVIGHGAMTSITQNGALRSTMADRRYIYRGHSMPPTKTERVPLTLRHGDVVLVRPFTAMKGTLPETFGCTVIAEEAVTPRALHGLEDLLESLVEDVLQKQAVADATTGEEAITRSDTRLVRHTLFLDALVNATAAIISPSISLEYATRVEGLFLRARSVSGTADVKAEYATSWDGTEYDSFDDNADITSSTVTDKANNTEGFNTFSVAATLNRYIQIRVTGVAANPADTRVTAYLIVREGYAR